MTLSSVINTINLPPPAAPGPSAPASLQDTGLPFLFVAALTA